MVKPDHTTENILATIGAVCWTIQIIPQIWKSWREKSTHGLSMGLVGIWGVSAIPLGTYIVAQRLSIPLQVQPHAFGVLSAISVGQCLYYGRKWSLRKTLLVLGAFMVFWAGFETGSIYAVWAGQDNGTDAPLLLYGYLSAVLLAVALLPQYWEIYRLGEVVGVSMLFMAIDIIGGIFSLLSLIFREDFDVAAGVSYSLVVVLDGIVVLLALILNPIARRRRRKAELAATSEEVRIGTPSEEITRVGEDDGHGCADGVDGFADADEGDEVDEVDERGEKIARVMPMPDLRVHPDVRNHDLHHHTSDLPGRTGSRTRGSEVGK